MLKEQPIVSVVVVTYNSSKTVLDTLESIAAQTYQNIELIISDDCSKDNTVAICKSWLDSHISRFARTKLLLAEVNRGVCVNANKGRFAASGEWVHGIAGDDILLPNCIEDNVKYVQEHPDASFVFSYLKVYNEDFKEEHCVNQRKGPRNPELFELPIEKQLVHMAYAAYIYMNTMFARTSAFMELGGFSDRYGYEDWPFFIDMLEKGYRCDLLDSVTVGYRVHDSASHSDGKLFNYKLTQATIPFIKERCFKYYSVRKKFAVKAQWLMEKILYNTHLDKATPIMSFLYRKTTAALFKLGNSSLKHIQ
jgi:alpha-1,3-rhamnosyltransferase